MNRVLYIPAQQPAALRAALQTVCLVAVAFGVIACRGATSSQPPLAPERNMYQQQRYNPQSRSTFFEDGRSMRKPVAHTFAREMIPSSEIANGELADGTGYVLAIPESVIADFGGMDATMARGEQRFNIYCSPCHDLSGSGKGEIIKRGMSAPPTFHDDRIRHMPDGQMFATISNGVRNMPAYSYSIPVNDRWAIVAYVRALELSQAGEQ